MGALFFGHLTDRFGRRNLFILTLAVYLVATVATAFAFAPWYFFIARFFTGSGIGGEYAAINSAIDELIPARVRGRVDLVINGTYWLGSAAGAAGALVLLEHVELPGEHRMAARLRHRRPASAFSSFSSGATFRRVRGGCSSTGASEEAERIVGEIEEDGAAGNRSTTARAARAAAENPSAHRRFRSVEIAKVAFKLYPRRAVLGLALFIGQAFLYNGVTFNLGTLLSGFYAVPSATVPLFFILWALSNFVGPLLLGRLFDTVGRKPMITLSYIGSAVSWPLSSRWCL